MKGINYFLEEEKKYNETPMPDMIYIEGAGFEFPEEPLNFLRQKPFASMEEAAKSKHGEYGLSDVEWLMLFCFLGHFSCFFRSDNYHGEIPDIVKEMQLILDSVVRKAPKCDSKILYRFLNDFDKGDFQIEDIYIPAHSLTTTTDDWGKDTDMYVIAPLPTEKTKAHSLYKLHNHGKEYQVNFERRTKFKITKIEESQEYKTIFLSEMQ